MSYVEELVTVENFGPYAKIPSTTLTEEERKSTPFSPLFDVPVYPPSEETIRALMPGNEMDPADAILPEEIGKMFIPGAIKVENGYCLLPQGFGYSIVKIDMPKVQPQMIPFFMNWYTKSVVHYRTWLPDMHLEMQELEKGHVAVEDLGWGPVKPVLGAGAMFSPQMFGIENPTDLDPDFVFFLGGSNPFYSPEKSMDDEPDGYTSGANYIRKKGTGVEWRMISWLGVRYVDGQYILDDNLDEIPLLERVRMLACHNAWEWNRMGTLLPELVKFSQENGLMPEMPAGGPGGPGFPGAPGAH